VVVDPLNSFISAGNESEVKAMLMRLVDYLKLSQITGFFTSLTTGGSGPHHTDAAISSLIDTWLMLLAVESGGERNRVLSILKSRGMAHSNQTREFLITSAGVQLCDVYTGAGSVLTGSARLAQEAEERARQLALRQEIERQQRALERKRAAVDGQIAALRLEFEAQQADTQALIERRQARAAQLARERLDMAWSRKADTPTESGEPS
ncbi:ATPase domain-containing protein, partial [uncultured Lamprocystis sp.]